MSALLDDVSSTTFDPLAAASAIAPMPVTFIDGPIGRLIDRHLYAIWLAWLSLALAAQNAAFFDED